MTVRNVVSVGATTSSMIVASLLLHYEALRSISSILPRVTLKPRQKILLLVSLALLAHLLEVLMFAVAFWLMFEIDGPPGSRVISFAQAFYLSIESYASLGTSTGYPIGPMRFLAGIEALLGLLLIGWTASYTYLAMERFWDEHVRTEKTREPEKD